MRGMSRVIKLKFDIGLLGTQQNQESCEKKLRNLLIYGTIFKHIRQIFFSYQYT